MAKAEEEQAAVRMDVAPSEVQQLGLVVGAAVGCEDGAFAKVALSEEGLAAPSEDGPVAPLEDAQL